ncbi:MAG TPA: flagellar hook protein FlgE [Fimbriimonadaceae bacterium]|nr:flagellar hook protein FlgE [Fimbriimonadaceae bacterium]
MLAGVASIKAQQTRMNVIGNNLANINTTGYKSSRVTFEDMIAQTLQGATRPGNGLGGINPSQIGLGTIIGATSVNETQGSLSATNNPTDLAIQGNGFFLVSNGSNISYTRDGAFTLDANGDLVSSSTGQRVLGWPADALGQIDSTNQIDAADGINIPVGLLKSVQQTTQATLSGNLDAGAASTDTLTTQVTVYDGLGNAHQISIQYSNHQVPAAGSSPPAGATSSWDWTAWEGQPGTGTPIGDSTTSGNDRLYFDADGKLLTPSSSFNVTVPASNGATALPISLNFDKITQLSTSSEVNPTGQNGFPPGSLSSFNIGDDGLITGNFSNGLNRTLGQIALSVFPNPGGLERIGDNMWRATDNSGLPVTGAPRSGSNGSISAGFLEQSNVDVGNEFSDLIVTQRGFQANTKVVTTVDQMMQDLIDMKR